MTTFKIDRVTLTAAAIADIFAEGERRTRAGETRSPPDLASDLPLPEYGVLMADYFIELACQQAVIDHFDIDVIRAGTRAFRPVEARA